MEAVKEGHINVVSHLQEQNDHLKSDKKLLACDLCGFLSVRCVGIPCCPSIGCRSCFVKYIREHHRCWACERPLETDKILAKYEVRRWISGIQRKTGLSLFLDDGARMRFAEWKSPLDVLRRSREEKIRKEDAEDYKNYQIPHKPRSNFERIIQAKQSFQNSASVNTEVNLSFHGFKRFGGDKRKKYDEKKLPMKIFKIHCLDGGHLTPRSGFEKILCDKDKLLCDTSVSANYEDNEPVPFSLIPLKLKRILFESIKPKFGDNYSKYDGDKSELLSLIRDFTDSFAENLEFQLLVNNNNLSLTRGKLEQVVDTEEQLRRYQNIYSETEMAWCKVCRDKHWFL